MSRVYFHSPSETAELLGSERAWASSIVEDIATGIVLPRFGDQVDRLLELVPRDHYLHQRGDDSGWLLRWHSSFQTAWRVQLDLEWRGRKLDAWTFSLNTALVLGNDAVKFLARMHAQCELHGWVEGPDRAWLAGVLEQGRALGIYRPNAGWEGVVDLLRQRDDEPVVMSYSVCDQFPNPWSTAWRPADGDEDRESWYDLADEEQWEFGMQWLRAEPGLKALSPDGWSEVRMDHGLTVFDLIAPDRDERLDRALGLVAA